MYVYEADLWCDDCGAAIIAEREAKEEKLREAGKDAEADAIADDRESGETDRWPQEADESVQETDSPYHCAAGEKCLNAIELEHGTIGALIEEQLTREGARYVHDAMVEKWGEVTELWHDAFGVSFERGDLTIRLSNSDDDPTQIIAEVSAPFASQWADDVGSLAGGTWETADGDELVYEVLHWEPDLFEDLEKEGYRFDYSEYDEPDEDDLFVAKHASECTACSGDWHRGQRHCEKLGLDLRQDP